MSSVLASLCVVIDAITDVTMKFAVFLLLLVAGISGNEEDFRIIDSIIQEQSCIAVGGICTVAADCPKGHLAERQGLCPTQRKQGIDCCHGVSMKETRCLKHGGVCTKPEDYCNPSLVFDGATDCTGDLKCCIMTI